MKKINKEQYITEKELERFECFITEFCKAHTYASALSVAKTYREKYMPELYNQHILLYEVERSLKHRASRLLIKGYNDGYLTKFSKKTYQINHKKFKKYLETLEND